MTLNNTATKGDRNETAVRVVHEPSRFNLLNAPHLSYSPIQSKTRLLYVSGTRQVTEFVVGQEGFSIFVWVRNMNPDLPPTLRFYQAAEPTSKKMWKALEVDCLSGHARLSDRAAVRGVGGNPNNRKEARATDDVSTVVNWVKRAEIWYERSIAKQRRSVLGANAALATESNADGSGGSSPAIPFLPVSLEVQFTSDERLNRQVNADVLPAFLNVGCVKHWDHEGGLAIRGKRVAGGLSNKTVIGKRERISRYQDTARFQLGKAAELVESDPEESQYYLELAQDSEDKARKLQADLNARMEKARNARKAKSLEKVGLHPVAAQALLDQEEHVKREIEASAKLVDETMGDE